MISRLRSYFNELGPATLITAAFIGPGTVTLCSISGVEFGYQLLWTILFAIIATILLQEMSARIGIVTQKSIVQVIKAQINNRFIKVLTLLLVISAILIGNSAYQSGNISGAVLGIESVLGKFSLSIQDLSVNLYPILVGLLASVAILTLNSYRTLEKIFIGLVLLMSFAFLITAILLRPSIPDILGGLFIPSYPINSLLTVIGLIGTTVVPYNLFLHSNLARNKWKDSKKLKFALRDLIISVSIGGLISIAIIITAAASNLDSITTVADLSSGLGALLGEYSTLIISIGLFAAGFTSAVTAPLAAAFVTCNCLGWNNNLESKYFKGVFLLVLLIGVLVASLNFQLISIIKFAQIVNGILLPIIVGILIWIMNKSNVLGKYVNNTIQNIAGVLIFLFTLGLSLKTIITIFG